MNIFSEHGRIVPFSGILFIHTPTKDMEREKKNCWEVKLCGREPGGIRVQEMGICPASTEKKLHGVHDGINAGRACWVVAGSMCGGKIQGTFAQKYENCNVCDFYMKVKFEENHDFKLSATLLSKLLS